MTCHPRMSSWGALTGLAGAALGAGAVVSLGSPAGWIVGLLAGAALGGGTILLATRRLMRDATACLASLGEESRGWNRTGFGADEEPALPALGSPAFDAWIGHLDRLFVDLRSVHAEYAEVERLVRRLGGGTESSGSAMNPSESTGEKSHHSLQAFLDQFRRTAVQINRDVLALQEANERVASGAQDQSEAVSRTATSVEALSDRIDRISRNAAEASEACERARQEAHQGLDQVNSVIEGMDRLLSRIEANGRKVRRLGDRSSEIGVIVELIRGISSRTDMLALNATIESIRAGEHGRGFAIVADEIRKLAERAATATSEIATLVDAIQADTQESIQALGEEQAETQRESQRIRETGSALARISQVVEKSARLVDGISRSTNDQVVTTQDLVRAMQRISDVTQQTQERTTQARAFIKALNHSCGSWQRLSSEPGAPTAMGTTGTSDSEVHVHEGTKLFTPAQVKSTSKESPHVSSTPTARAARGPVSVRHDVPREGVGSERSR